MMDNESYAGEQHGRDGQGGSDQAHGSNSPAHHLPNLGLTRNRKAALMLCCQCSPKTNRWEWLGSVMRTELGGSMIPEAGGNGSHIPLGVSSGQAAGGKGLKTEQSLRW